MGAYAYARLRQLKSISASGNRARLAARAHAINRRRNRRAIQYTPCANTYDKMQRSLTAQGSSAFVTCAEPSRGHAYGDSPDEALSLAYPSPPDAVSCCV